jgi:hypothetical protein
MAVLFFQELEPRPNTIQHTISHRRVGGADRQQQPLFLQLPE